MTENVNANGAAQPTAPTETTETATAIGPTEVEVMEQLRRLIDPEVGINIVDLGLIYEVHIKEGRVLVEMTLTTPACPLSGAFDRAVRKVITEMPGVTDAHVEFVFDPPWSPDLISEAGREQMNAR